MKPSAYIVGIYHEEKDLNHMEGVKEGDIYVVMRNTTENMKLAKELLINYK